MNKVRSISLVSFATALVFFYSSIFIYGMPERYAMTGGVCSIILLLPWVLNALGKTPLDRVLLSVTIPVFICAVSVLTGLILLGADPLIRLNSLYFSRIFLLMSITIPFITIKFSSRKSLIVALVVPSLCLLLFDLIHHLAGTGLPWNSTSFMAYYVTANVASTLSLGAFVGSMIYLKTRIEHVEFKHIQKIGHLELYLKDLISLSNSPAVLNGDADGTYKQVAERIRNSLGVNRVSIWEFNPDHSEIRCTLLSGKDGVDDKPMIILSAKDHPKYFEAIKKHKLVIATDARNHGATKSFANSYLKPLNIFSMMDIAFMNDGKLAGIICCEQQVHHKHWFVEDSLFLSAMGDTVSYMHSNRKKILRNEELEEHVKTRTQELERKNEQLSEYAYINSHVLRAPVARIMGIFELLNTTKNDEIDKEIMKHFKLSVEELDEITLKIKRAIEEYGLFDRDQITKQMNE